MSTTLNENNNNSEFVFFFYRILHLKLASTGLILTPVQHEVGESSASQVWTP